MLKNLEQENEKIYLSEINRLKNLVKDHEEDSVTMKTEINYW